MSARVWLGLLVLGSAVALSSLASSGSLPGGPSTSHSNYCNVDVANHETTCRFHCHATDPPLENHLLYIMVSGPAEVAGEAFCGRLLLCADVHSCFNQTVSGYEATGTCRIIQGTSVTCGDWAY